MNKTLFCAAIMAVTFSFPAVAQGVLFCGEDAPRNTAVGFSSTIFGHENVCFGDCPDPPPAVDVACWRALDPDLASLYTAKQIAYCKKRKEGEDDLRRAQRIAANRPRAEADRKILDQTMSETNKP